MPKAQVLGIFYIMAFQKIIGLTGGIGAGKSTVAQVFSVLGFPIYNSDRCAKTLIQTNLVIKNAIVDLLGEGAYNSDGLYQTHYVAAKVFADLVLLKELNQIVHPAVSLDFESWRSQQTAGLLIKESALVNTMGQVDGVDLTLLVYSPIEHRLQRVLERDSQRTEQEVRAIISKQFDQEVLLKNIDYKVFNDDLIPIIPQVYDFLKKIDKQTSN
jgi:dephospho-CoA kinase